MAGEFKTVDNWVPIEGIWEIGQSPVATFLRPEESQRDRRRSAPDFGIALSNVRFASGQIKATVTLPEIGDDGPNQSMGHILLGFTDQDYSMDSKYISIGIGGFSEAFALDEFESGPGWRRLKDAGSAVNLKGNDPYHIEVGVNGQRVTLIVDGIKVIDHILSGALAREQIGLFASGEGPVEFDSIEVSTQSHSAFVVMQFTEQFNELFDEVIQPVCKGLEIDAYRASDIYRPGVVLQDILQGLDESYVVIAEITTRNANVFYELGYSHALKKPVILLAERGTELPFDISSYRVIFYDNTIGGKSSVEADLRRHLEGILGE